MRPSGSIDFETFGTAGYYFDGTRWRSVSKSPPHGLGAVGAAAYSEHPDTEVICLAYDVGKGRQLWVPGCPPPQDLFDSIANGGILKAWYSFFEYCIWLNICQKRLGWPPLPLKQTSDTMARAYAHSLPGALDKACEVLGTDIRKGKDGTRLINKFSKPRKPTKKDPRKRIRPSEDPADANNFYSYNLDDIGTESEIASQIPELSPFEQRVWELDQEINARGTAIDQTNLKKLIGWVEEAESIYTTELYQLTGIDSGNKRDKILKWCRDCGTPLGILPNLKADSVRYAIASSDTPQQCRRVLELRQLLSMASIAKLFAIDRRLSSDGRLRGLLQYGGADRTRRWAGRGPQPQNIPGGGPDVVRCAVCKRYCGSHQGSCVWCGAPVNRASWGVEAAQDTLNIGSFDELARAYRNPLKAISGCLRSLFVASEGHELYCGDFSSIEAVVLAELAGETWRQEVFRTHGKIYETSASRITGIPFEEYIKHKKQTGEHHPTRKTIGKVAELASGYGGWIGAWKRFGADKYFKSDQEIKEKILAWRKASPNIVEFWGGQVRKHLYRWEFRREYYGLEGAAVRAVLNPGQCFACRSITFGMKEDILYCRLPSGRNLTYHKPRLKLVKDRYSQEQIYQITYWGMNNDPEKPKIWMELQTYGGKLAENITQAIARDLLAYSMLCVAQAGYCIVLHVHDEIVCEVPHGSNTFEKFCQLMAEVPDWAEGWPVRVDGWYGKRYRKD